MSARPSAGRHVSRETQERLEAFATTLKRWNARINLVSRATADDLWTRHIADSIQLFDLRPAGTRRWADLGTGGGFPGLVLAIVAADEDAEIRFVLVESDARKVAFLQAAARSAGVSVDIRHARAEALDPLAADVVSARALAPLPELLPIVARHLREGGRALLPKGRAYATEIDEALARWRFTAQKHPSRTDENGVILSMEGVERA